MVTLFWTSMLAVAALCVAGATRLRAGPDRLRRTLRSMDPAHSGTTWEPVPFRTIGSPPREGAIALAPGAVVLSALAGGVVCWASMRLLVGQGALADLAALGGLWVPSWWLRQLAARRRERIAVEMEQVALSLEGAAGAGMTPYEAMVQTSARIGGIIGPELLRVIRDADRLGLSEALVLFRDRLPLPEVRLLAASLRLHQGAGAATAEALMALARTLRQRREAITAIRTATTSGRMQANMLMAVPPALIGLLRAAYPAFLHPLLKTGVGQLVLGLCAVWMLLGYGMIRRMVVPRLTL